MLPGPELPLLLLLLLLPPFARAAGRVQYASPATGDVLGLRAEDAVGTSILSSVDPSDVDVLRAKMRVLGETIASTGKPQMTNMRCRMIKHGGGFFQARICLQDQNYVLQCAICVPVSGASARARQCASSLSTAPQ